MPDGYPIILLREEIMKILPHHDPFLFLNKGEIIGPLTARGWMIFPADWPIFQGHFPGRPIVPGVILQEVLGQTASLVVKVIPECQGLIGVFTGVDKVKYRGAVHPNEEIQTEAKIVSHKKMGDSVFGTFEGVGKVGELDVITMIARFAVVPPEKIESV